MVDGETDAVEVGVVADADADEVFVVEDVRCPSVVSAVSGEYKQDPIGRYVQATSDND